VKTSGRNPFGAKVSAKREGSSGLIGELERAHARAKARRGGPPGGQGMLQTSQQRHRREGLGETGEQFGFDHVSADAGNAPVGEIEIGRLRFRSQSGARVVAEIGTEAQGASPGGDQPQPLQGAPGEIGGVKEIHAQLAGRGGDHLAHQSHVVIKREPRGYAIVGLKLEGVFGDGARIGHEGALTDLHAERKAGAPGGELNVADLFRLQRREGFFGGGKSHQLGGGENALGRHVGRRRAQALYQALLQRVRHGDGADVDVFENARQLKLVAQPAAQPADHGQGHRHEASVLAGMEQGHEVGVHVRQHSDVLASLDSEGRESFRLLDGPPPDIGIGDGVGEFPARGVEMEPVRGAGGVVHRRRQRIEIGSPEGRRTIQPRVSAVFRSPGPGDRDRRSAILCRFEFHESTDAG